jgi:heat shock protein HtpX
MLPAFGLYTHIQANRHRSWALIASLFVLSFVLVFAIALLMRGWSGSVPNGYRHGLGGYIAAALHDMLWLGPVAVAGSIVWITIAFHVNQSLIDMATGARVVTRTDAPRLYHQLENLCISRGMSVPTLRVMDSEAPNAFASGITPDQYSITVTSGLLATLNDAEIECVLAHELTHIRNDDVRTMMIAIVVTGILSFAGELILRGNNPIRLSSRGGDSKDKGGAAAAVIIAIVLIALVWLLSQFVKFALSRSREYLADAGAVELTKNPDAMISALQKIDGKGEIETVPSGIMELCLDNPRSGLQDMFATHPSIADRIEALRRYAGGRVEIPEATIPQDAPATAETPPEPQPQAAAGSPWNRRPAG